MPVLPLPLIAPWAIDRLTLLLNHVLASEPVASARLRPFAGQALSVRWSSAPGVRPPAWVARALSWPEGLPPDLCWTVTPAGLLEWRNDLTDARQSGDLPTAALTLTVTLDHPWQMAWRAVRGERPEVQIEGDAQMAEAASWIMKNLHWDIEDDLSRWLGAAPTELLRRTAESARDALEHGWQHLRTQRASAKSDPSSR